MSLTFTGLIAIVLSWFLQFAGLPATSDEITTFLKVALAIVGAVSVYIGRYRLGGVNWWGKRTQ